MASDTDSCFAGLAEDPERAAKLSVLTQYEFWTDGAPWALLRVAQALVPSLNVRGAEELAVAALEAAVPVSSCDAGVLAAIAKRAQALRAAESHSPSYDSRLDALPALVHHVCP